MNLVEVVRGEETSDETVRKVCKIAEAVDKTPIVVKDSPGFIVNRLLLPFLNDAVLLLERGVGSPEDIDTAVRMGLNHPMGPFRLLDLIGLDTFARAMQNMGMEPAQRIQNMISKGKLGRKTGKGFYRYR
jgi:3-hydroxybutyryl-CoA dehydrogenase